MKKVLLTLAMLGTIVAGNAQNKATKTAAEASHWSVDASHTTVKFSVSHMVISEVDGRFKVFNGNVDAVSADFNDAKVNFDVDVNSINTDNEMRDNHLKGDDFFNAAKYPKMTFQSTSFKKTKGNNYTLEGNLTIREVTRKIKFAVVYGGTVKDPYGNIKAGFKATGKINRKDYGLKWSAVTEAGGAVVGDEVNMVINLEVAKQK
jgi:polyisoprenoid-binding protein YceI